MDGSWNKAAVTSALCKFIGNFCQKRNLENAEDEALRLVDSGFSKFTYHVCLAGLGKGFIHSTDTGYNF